MSCILKTTEVHKPRLPLIIWLVILLHIRSPSVNATVEVNKTESPSAQPRFGETFVGGETVPVGNGSDQFSGKTEGARRKTVVSDSNTYSAVFLQSSPVMIHPLESGKGSDVNKTIVQGHCNSSTIYGSDSEGRVKWVGQGKAATCWWQIDITTVNHSGLVLQFDEVALRRGPKAAEDDTVTVFLGVQADPSKELTRIQGSLPVSPILVPSAVVLLRLEAYSWQSTWDDPLNSFYQHHSRFSLTSIAQSLHSLPPQVAQSTVGRYNCSAPYHVPPALLCDMVEQCAAGEDEENCSYKTTACGDWISLEHRKMCFKFVFPFSHVTAAEGSKECVSVYKGMLAELLDPELKQFAANIMSKSGHSEALVGLQKVRHYLWFQNRLNDMYTCRYLWTWLNTLHLELDAALLITPLSSPDCAVLSIVPLVHFRPVSCIRKLHGYVCMKYINTSEFPFLEYSGERSFLKPIRRKPQEFRMKMCRDGSFVHAFQSCFFNSLVPTDTEQEMSKLRLFLCGDGGSVPYSNVCDILSDCPDGSDETGCSALHYTLSEYSNWSKETKMCGDGKKSFHVDHMCNGYPECEDLSDELCLSCAEEMKFVRGHGCVPEYQYIAESALTGGDLDETGHDIFFADDVAVRKLLVDGIKKAASLRILHTDGYGFGTVSAVTGGDCPDTHFRCKAGLCIPSYMVGDGMLRDCPIYSHDDEMYRNIAPFIIPDPCPGYFRCASHTRCIHWKYVCDGMVHCHRGYDELFCIPCPTNCICSGLEYTCQQMFKPTYSHLHLKYLNLSHVFQPSLYHLEDLIFLYYLNLSYCSLQELPPLKLHYRLTVLDLSFNHLLELSKIQTWSMQLRYLNLSNNPLLNGLVEYSFRQLFFDHNSTVESEPILSLSLRETSLQSIRPKAFKRFHGLTFLDISGNSIKHLEENMFVGLKSLKTLVASDSRLCCAYSHQYSEIKVFDCQAPEDELSSCEDLLRSGFLRVTLWLQSVMAVVGNAGVFVFRVFVEFQKTSSSFRVLVSNLSVADLLMGLYMMTIGAADAHFSGQYVWKQTSWTESVQCKMAGFLAVLCSEMSAFIICIITVDRLLVLRFPFKKHLHLTPRSAMLVCAVSWSVALMLAAIPLFPITQHWMFYSQTGICLPLPITRRQFPGRTYSFAVFIVLNFVLFLLISVGQVFNYVTIRNTPTAGRTDRHQQDMTIARRLFLIVFTDFCCWFPVGVMGLLAARGIPIPGQVDVWTAVFVLPLNSALNPFLYTLNVLLEQHMKRLEQKRLKHVVKIIRTDIMNWPEERVIEIIHSCDAAMKRFQSADNRGNEVRTTNEGRVEQAVHVTIETHCLD